VRPALAAAVVFLVVLNLAVNLPARMGEAKGFYGITRDQFRPIDEEDPHNALVIVYAERWLEYGALLSSMSPTLDDNIVYARGSGPEADAKVIAAYPGRTVYYLVEGQLTPIAP
jgi:hypothetical protein